MITYEYIDVVRGGFEWVDMDVTETDTGFIIAPGRIGRAENPLVIENGLVTGGWAFAGANIELGENDCSIDIVLDKIENELYVLIRTGDPEEVYPAERYEHLLNVVRREQPEQPWRVSRPVYRIFNE